MNAAAFLTFLVVTANVRATPPMRWRNVIRCVARCLAVPGVSVVCFNEFQGRRLQRLLQLAGHPTWRAVQGPKGDRARSPIAYDSETWLEDPDHPAEFVQLSHARVGRLWVPSGNRFATVVVLRHRATGLLVCFVAYHSIAHMNLGAHFGWTGKGPRVLLRLRGKIPNPAVTVYKEGMVKLEGVIHEKRALGIPVVPTGDWNFDAFADLRAQARGTAEKYGPHRTMGRARVSTIYSAGKLHRGTAGRRGIDYIGVTGGHLVAAGVKNNRPSDHELVWATIRVPKRRAS